MGSRELSDSSRPKIFTLDQLGLPEQIKQLTTLQKGLVVVTGPPGSGKSTTLAAILNAINQTERKHILTIEDPVEYVHPNLKCLVNQRTHRTKHPIYS